MAKLYFRYGAMGSSKTAQALMTKFNYEEKGQKVWLIKPSTDNRDDIIINGGVYKTIIKSRIGLQCEAEVVSPEDNIYFHFKEKLKDENYNVIICDECQFLTEQQVNFLRKIVDKLNVPVFCFGLRSDFKTRLFTGSKRLFEVADSISEIKSICQCGNKAIFNMRFNKSGNMIISGKTVDIGGNEKYKSFCSHCYYENLYKIEHP